jgi:hypothetical protein
MAPPPAITSRACRPVASLHLCERAFPKSLPLRAAGSPTCRAAGRCRELRRWTLLRVLPHRAYLVETVAEGGCRCCCQQHWRLLPAAAGVATKGGRDWYKGLESLLPATEEDATSERRWLLPAAASVATKGIPACYKKLEALLPAPASGDSCWQR